MRQQVRKNLLLVQPVTVLTTRRVLTYPAGVVCEGKDLDLFDEALPDEDDLLALLEDRRFIMSARFNALSSSS